MAEEKTTMATIERDDDFISLYANNIQLEQSFFDLKLILGESDQSQGAGRHRIIQYGSVTISWLQAKLLVYYLQLAVTGYEVLNEKIKVPAELFPTPIPPLPEGRENQKAIDLVAALKVVREKFLASL